MMMNEETAASKIARAWFDGLCTEKKAKELAKVLEVSWEFVLTAYGREYESCEKLSITDYEGE